MHGTRKSKARVLKKNEIMIVLSLQETLLGCISEMPGNLNKLSMIYSMMGMRLDQDEYLTHWIVSQDCLRIFKQCKAFKSYYQIGESNG